MSSARGMVSSMLRQCAVALERAGSELSVTTLKAAPLSVSMNETLPTAASSASAAFVAPTANVSADTQLGPSSSVWYSATVTSSTIGAKAAVLDGACVSNSEIGASVEIGANAIVSGAVVSAGVRIGPRATIADGVTLGADVTVPPGALVTESIAASEASTSRAEALLSLATAHELETSKSYQVLLVEEEDHWDATHRSDDYHKRLPAGQLDENAVGGRVPGRIMNSPINN